MRGANLGEKVEVGEVADGIIDDDGETVCVGKAPECREIRTLEERITRELREEHHHLLRFQRLLKGGHVAVVSVTEKEAPVRPFRALAHLQSVQVRKAEDHGLGSGGRDGAHRTEHGEDGGHA